MLRAVIYSSVSAAGAIAGAMADEPVASVGSLGVLVVALMVERLRGEMRALAARVARLEGGSDGTTS